MLRSLFLKEWLKTRMVVLLALTVSLGLCVYILQSVSRLIDANGMMLVWDTLLNRDVLLVDMLRFVPLVVGVLLGVSQMLPEVLQKRIKLTLHLPIAMWESVGVMVLYGAIVMVGLMVLNLGVCAVVMSSWFPKELLQHIFLTAVVWYIAGLLAYFFAIWVVLEPTWVMRVLELLFAAVCLRGFYMSTMPEVYNAFLPIMVVFTVLCAGLPLLSIDRFKRGIGL